MNVLAEVNQMIIWWFFPNGEERPSFQSYEQEMLEGLHLTEIIFAQEAALAVLWDDIDSAKRKAILYQHASQLRNKAFMQWQLKRGVL